MSDSDRMGARLDGPDLSLRDQSDLLSEAVTPGTLQVPPNGKPILLLGDCQTIGGYPKIAHVITVDLPIAAQLWPGDLVRFHEVSLTEAQELLREREEDFGRFRVGLSLHKRMNLVVDLNSDLGEGAGHDEEILDLVSSANIACGFHAGDPASIFASIQAALERGVAVGAHPSFADRENFGRTEITIPPAEAYSLRRLSDRSVSSARARGRRADESRQASRRALQHGGARSKAGRSDRERHFRSRSEAYSIRAVREPARCRGH